MPSKPRNSTPADDAVTVGAAARGAIALRENRSIAMTPDRAVTVRDDADYTDIQAMIAEYGMAEFPGASVVEKLDLLGVPFTILGVRMNRFVADPRRQWRDFMSIAIVTANEEAIQDQIRYGRVLRSVGKDPERYTRVDDMKVKPATRYILNDGSTGVRRQIVSFLDALGMISVGGEVTGNPREDRARYDLAWNMWENPMPLDGTVGQSWVSADGTMIPRYESFPDGRPLLFNAPRGLSGSWYVNEFAPDGATTFYVA